MYAAVSFVFTLFPAGQLIVLGDVTEGKGSMGALVRRVVQVDTPEYCAKSCESRLILGRE